MQSNNQENVIVKCVNNDDHKNSINQLIKSGLHQDQGECLNQAFLDFTRHAQDIYLNDQKAFISKDEDTSDIIIRIGRKRYAKLKDAQSVGGAFAHILGVDADFGNKIFSTFNQASSAYAALVAIKYKLQTKTFTQNMLSLKDDRFFSCFKKINNYQVEFKNAFTLYDFALLGIFNSAPEVLKIDTTIRCDVDFSFFYDKAKKDIEIKDINLKLTIPDKKAKYAIAQSLLQSKNSDTKDVLDYFDKHAGQIKTLRFRVKEKEKLIIQSTGFLAVSITCALLVYLNEADILNLRIPHELSAALFVASVTFLCVAIAVTIASAIVLIDCKKEYKTSEEECELIANEELKNADFNKIFDEFTLYLQNQLKEKYVDYVVSNCKLGGSLPDAELMRKLSEQEEALDVKNAQKIAEQHQDHPSVCILDSLPENKKIAKLWCD